jgi:hypothetical protein
MSKYSREFGCEFEFSSSFHKVAKIARKAIGKVYGGNSLRVKDDWYSSVNNKRWHMKTDASTDCELATPVSSYPDLNKIFKVISFLKKSGEVKVSKRDAFHVHINAKDISPDKLIVAWIQMEKIFSMCFPSHRRNNTHYCAHLLHRYRKNDTLAKYFKYAFEESTQHHVIFSLHHYEARKTVEFRICEGTLDTELIQHLIRFYMSFLDYAKKFDATMTACEEKSISKINDLFNVIEVPYSTETFLIKRFRKFS